LSTNDAVIPMRRPTLKRAAVWTTVVLLLLALYVAGAPIIWFVTWKYVPDLIPVVSVCYVPFNIYRSHPDWPGSVWIGEYYDWCYNETRRLLQ
jgi:hypothetical protein